MKDKISGSLVTSIAFSLLFIAPALAFADAQVQVYPTITNAYGGTRFAAQLSTKITYGSGQTQDQTGVPTYDLGPGPVNYAVTADSYAGYSATLDSNCSGTAQDGQLVVCNINWNDGAPIAPTPTVTAAVIPQVSQPAPVVQPTQPSATSTDEEQQIAALQAEIQQLYKILIALLSQKLAAIK